MPASASLRGLRRFGSDTAGAAALEFAFVAGPFLFMLFAVMEIALIFLLSTSLDAASDKAARRIRTGQFQSASQTKADFKTAICANMTWMASGCTTNLMVHVTIHDQYNQVTNYDPIDTTTGTRRLKAEQNFPVLAPEKVVVVRSYYQWPLISPFMTDALQRTDNGKALISATQTFVTEPYQ